MQDIDIDDAVNQLDQFYLKHRKYTLKQLGKLIGFNEVTVGRWIRGKLRPTRKSAYKILEVLKGLKENENI